VCTHVYWIDGCVHVCVCVHGYVHVYVCVHGYVHAQMLPSCIDIQGTHACSKQGTAGSVKPIDKLHHTDVYVRTRYNGGVKNRKLLANDKDENKTRYWPIINTSL
jgi:hypothetical protein